MSTHIEEFAERLRLLKERSGRSYGTIAARLHVSTSTLHRYCNGVAVPAEYAPVERFARQCGASTQELVALHQLWLLADAARRLNPNRPPQPAGAGGTVSARAEELTPTAPEPTGAEQPGPVPTASRAPEGAAVPAEGNPTGDLPTTVDVPSVLSSQPPRRFGRRTGLAILAVAVVLAAVFPLALPMLHRALHAPLLGAKVRPSPSAQPASGDGEPPVQVTVLSDNWDSQCGQWFLLQQPPGRVPPLPSLQQTNAWAAALNGIPAQDLRLQLTAQSRPGEPVVLHTLYVKVVNSAPAPTGNGYTLTSGCGGGLDPALFAIDLDATRPRAHSVSGFDGGDRQPAVNFPLQVSESDPEVLDVDAHTLDHDVSWYLYLVWSSGTRQGTLRIDNHGHPFRTVGLKGDPLYWYTGTSWSPTSPDDAP